MPLRPNRPRYIHAPMRRNNPSDYLGLLTWLKADAITGLSDADPMPATWEDSGAANKDWAKSGTVSWETNETPLGGPVARFTGGGSFASPSPLFSGTTSAELFICFRSEGSDDDNPGFFNFGGNDRTYWTFTDEQVYTGAFTNTRHSFTASKTVEGVWLVVNIYHDGTDRKILIDNAEEHSVAIAYTEYTSAAKLGESGLTWNGDIAEVVVYDRALTGTQRTAVHDYLRARHIVTPVGPQSLRAMRSRRAAAPVMRMARL